MLANLSEWEEHEAAARARHEQVQMKIQELEALKRDMGAQLERLRVGEQYPPFRLIASGRLRMSVYMWVGENEVVGCLNYRCVAVLGALWTTSTSAKESLATLLNKYEETRLQVAQYTLQHQNDIPFAKYGRRVECAAAKFAFRTLILVGPAPPPSCL